MVEEKKTTTTKRKKPSFLRNDWHKKIKLGSTVKKNRKWRMGRGRHNKIRLNRKGHPGRPKIGYSEDRDLRDKIDGFVVVRIENLTDLENVGKEEGIIIGKVGKKKREDLIKKAKELKIKILNRYKEKKNESD
jgi:large subunit ribosomal protein L32e